MEIIDASECSLTLKMVSAPSKSITIEYINYGGELDRGLARGRVLRK
jgi:hypothetical protein